MSGAGHGVSGRLRGNIERPHLSDHIALPVILRVLAHDALLGTAIAWLLSRTLYHPKHCMLMRLRPTLDAVENACARLTFALRCLQCSQAWVTRKPLLSSISSKCRSARRRVSSISRRVCISRISALAWIAVMLRMAWGWDGAGEPMRKDDDEDEALLYRCKSKGLARTGKAGRYATGTSKGRALGDIAGDHQSCCRAEGSAFAWLPLGVASCSSSVFGASCRFIGSRKVGWGDQ